MSIINKVEGGKRIEHVTSRDIERKINRVQIKNNQRQSRMKQRIINHIYENIKNYVIIIIIFLIGIIAGVVFINHIDEEQLTKIQEYINEFIVAIKGEYQIDKNLLLQSSLWNNLILTIAMWFMGSTVIGLPIVFGIVLYRGFCIGYTISASIAIYGIQKGMLFSIITMLLQNIVFIPVLLVLTVSGIRLYQSIMKDKRKENIKLEIFRHTAYSIISFLFFMVSSLIEVYVSSSLLEMTIEFF